VQSTSLTEVPGGQPLGLPLIVNDLLNDISTFLYEVKGNANKLARMEKTLASVKYIEELGAQFAKEDGARTEKEKNADLLEE